MSGFLFQEVIFGPVRSRRLGLSLGVNLLPLHEKFCTYNCIYCECGWTLPETSNLLDFPSRVEVATWLERKLTELAREAYLPDSITFAGNGEPTLHPQFSEIVSDTLALRDRLAPKTRVAVLSNASMLHKNAVFEALKSVDDNILKLDAGSEKVFNLINNPVDPVDFQGLIDNLMRFDGKLIIQSMFLRGTFKGHIVDNTTPEEVDIWTGHLKKIRPARVMIYPIARETPVHNLEKIPPVELEAIAKKVTETGLRAQVYP